MAVDNGLIRDALLRAAPQDLDEVLTAIEGYRLCMEAATRFHAHAPLDACAEALDFARQCEQRLRSYVETGELISVDSDQDPAPYVM